MRVRKSADGRNCWRCDRMVPQSHCRFCTSGRTENRPIVFYPMERAWCTRQCPARSRIRDEDERLLGPRSLSEDHPSGRTHYR